MRYVDDAKGEYTFEKHPAAVSYKEGDVILNLSSGKRSRICSHMAPVRDSPLDIRGVGVGE